MSLLGRKVRILRSPYPQAVGRIATVVEDSPPRPTEPATVKGRSTHALWCEYEDDVVFEGADPETQYVHRSWSFIDEVEVI